MQESRPMRAATIRDGGISVQEHPDPEPQRGELLVRVRAAGLNGADMLQLKGRYPAPPGAPPDIPGLELAGEVVAVGPGVERFEPGDRVMSIVAGGGQAELAVVSERVAMPIPDELDWTAAGQSSGSGTGMAARSCTTASSAWPPPPTTAMTRSPSEKRRAFGPVATTSPASSRPGMSGGEPGGAG